MLGWEIIIFICLNIAKADRFGRLTHCCTLSGMRNDSKTLLAVLACDCRNTVSLCPTTVLACQAMSQFYNTNDWNTNGANCMNTSQPFSRWSEKNFCLAILGALEWRSKISYWKNWRYRRHISRGSQCYGVRWTARPQQQADMPP
jgi:hypothetical protein